MSNEELKVYQELLSSIEILEEETERKLIKEAQTGDREAQNKVIHANLNLVLRLALSYQKNMNINTKADILDLIQEGCLGLIKAIKEFDCTKQTAFSNYAIWKIKGTFTDYFRKNDIIVYPAHIVALSRKLKSLGKNVTKEEIRTLYPITEKEWKLYQKYQNEVLRFGDLEDIPEFTDSIEQVEHKQYVQELKCYMQQVLDVLPEEECSLIKAKYYTEEHEISYRKVAKIIGIPQITCHKRLKKVKTKLRGIEHYNNFTNRNNHFDKK